MTAWAGAIALLAALPKGVPSQYPGAPWPEAGESVQECGLNCVLLMSRLAGRDCRRSDLLPVLSTSRDGTSMAGIRSALQRQGFGVAAVTADFDSLMRERKPAILHLQGPAHFVLAVAYKSDHALLVDFPRPPSDKPAGQSRQMTSRGNPPCCSSERAPAMSSARRLGRRGCGKRHKAVEGTRSCAGWGRRQ